MDHLENVTANHIIKRQISNQAKWFKSKLSMVFYLQKVSLFFGIISFEEILLRESKSMYNIKNKHALNIKNSLIVFLTLKRLYQSVHLQMLWEKMVGTGSVYEVFKSKTKQKSNNSSQLTISRQLLCLFLKICLKTRKTLLCYISVYMSKFETWLLIFGSIVSFIDNNRSVLGKFSKIGVVVKNLNYLSQLPAIILFTNVWFLFW